MITWPSNDHRCLGAISAEAAELARAQDPVVVELATRYPTEGALTAYFRSLPQRDDVGNPKDGPRVHECEPSQRLRLDAKAPNCVERAALWAAVMELIDPARTYQLKTIDTPYGLHTLPLVDGRPVYLDPGLPPDCIDCGLALQEPGPVAVKPRNAIVWSTELAAAEAAPLRNGPSTVHRARNAIQRLVNQRAVPDSDEIDAMGVLFALASRAAERFGPRAIGMVTTTMRAVAKILDTAVAEHGIEHGVRNLSFRIGDLNLSSPPWLDHVASAVGHTGLGIGANLARTQLQQYGIGSDLIGFAESEFNREGLTLGDFAHPPDVATFARYAAPRTAP